MASASARYVERVLVPVTPEEEIGEVEEGVELRLIEIVLAGDRETLPRSAVDCSGLVPSSREGLGTEGSRECLRRADGLGELDCQVGFRQRLSSSPMKK